MPQWIHWWKLIPVRIDHMQHFWWHFVDDGQVGKALVPRLVSVKVWSRHGSHDLITRQTVLFTAKYNSTNDNGDVLGIPSEIFTTNNKILKKIATTRTTPVFYLKDSIHTCVYSLISDLFPKKPRRQLERMVRRQSPFIRHFSPIHNLIYVISLALSSLKENRKNRSSLRRMWNG